MDDTYHMTRMQTRFYTGKTKVSPERHRRVLNPILTEQPRMQLMTFARMPIPRR